MLNKTNWNPKYMPFEFKQISEERLTILQKLLNHCFGGQTTIVRDTKMAKALLKSNIVTLTDGIDEEMWAIHDLVLNKLPYILFSNNWRSIASYRRYASNAEDPLKHLSYCFVSYMQRIRKQQNFKL